MTYRHDLVSVEALRTRILALEGVWQGAGRRGGAPGSAAASLGLGTLDRSLPWGGLPTGCLHEVAAGAVADGTAAGFAAHLLGCLATAEGGRPRPVLWCAPDRGLYGPGLARHGLDTRRLILVNGRSQADLLWAIEEGLRSGVVAAVVGEVWEADLTATRRLQLAAEAGRATALLLKPADAKPVPSAAVTAWRITAAPSGPVAWGTGARSAPLIASRKEAAPWAAGIGAERWRVELVRCRGGVPRQWLLEWNDETHRLAVAAELRNRPAHQELSIRNRCA
jgi:protein ImuA